ncbi:FkbM family methyltransferase [Streptomyces sp. O3]
MTLLDRARELTHRVGVGGGAHSGHARVRPPRCWPGPQLVQLLHRYAVDLVLDVGADTGGYGAQLRRGGYHGRIVSFEPLGRPRALLHRAAADDEFWSVLPYELGDPHGEQPTGEQRLDALWEDVVAPGERVFLKVDVPGQEAPVLRGLGEYVTECVGLQSGTSLGPALGPLHEHALLFHDTLTYAQQALGLTLTSVVPGHTHPESGQLLTCDLVLFKDDQAEDQTDDEADAQAADAQKGDRPEDQAEGRAEGQAEGQAYGDDPEAAAPSYTVSGAPPRS